MDTKITVIIPVYSVEKYLKKCVDSVLNQTHKNMEVILIDDGSTDSCGLICDEYARRDARVHVIHQKNGGVSCARNAGIRVASGDYISFIDSDDYIEEDMFEYMLSLKKDTLDILACGFERETFDGKIFTKDVIQDEPDVRQLSGDERLTYVWNVPFLWNKLFPIEIFIKCGIEFDPRIRHVQDSPVCFSAALNVENVLVGKKKKYHYIIRDNSATAQKWSIKKASCLYGYRYMSDRAKELRLTDKNRYVCGYVSQCIRVLLHREAADIDEVYKCITKEIRDNLFAYLFTNGAGIHGVILLKMRLAAVLFSATPTIARIVIPK